MWIVCVWGSDTFDEDWGSGCETLFQNLGGQTWFWLFQIIRTIPSEIHWTSSGCWAQHRCRMDTNHQKSLNIQQLFGAAAEWPSVIMFQLPVHNPLSQSAPQNCPSHLPHPPVCVWVSLWDWSLLELLPSTEYCSVLTEIWWSTDDFFSFLFFSLPLFFSSIFFHFWVLFSDGCDLDNFPL